MHIKILPVLLLIASQEEHLKIQLLWATARLLATRVRRWVLLFVPDVAEQNENAG